MSSPVVVGPFRSALGRSIVAALREDSTTFAVGGVHSLSFDRAGRLLRAFWGARSIRRSLDNRFIGKRRVGIYTWSQVRRELNRSESQGLCEEIFLLSPLAADSGSPYHQQERAMDIRRLTDVEMDAQLRALKTGLRLDPVAHPKVAIYDIRDFIY